MALQALGESTRTSDMQRGEEGGFSASISKKLEQILTQEDCCEEMSTLLIHYPLVLQAIEKSFSDVLYQNPSVPVSVDDDLICGCGSNPVPCGPRADGFGVDNEGVLQQFRRGEEEGNQLVPRFNFTNFGGDSMWMSVPCPAGGAGEVEGGGRNGAKALTIDEEREVFELSELFDSLFLRKGAATSDFAVGSGTRLPLSQKIPESKQADRAKKRRVEVVDLGNLLLNCAEAVAGNHGYMPAQEQLKQIRKHSSPVGNGSQRLAHYIANGFEARLAGVRIRGAHWAYQDPKLWPSQAELIRAHLLFTSVCPFRVMGSRFVDHHVLKLAESASKATLHIIDFGIFSGFQWAGLITRLSAIPGGPPKLRITGLEHPRCGFRSVDAVEYVGLRLAKHCRSVNVPFEYNGIAKDWVTVGIDDLKIGPNESVVVTSMLRFDQQTDDVCRQLCGPSPRDEVLKLIRSINPDIFIHFIENASLNATLFLRRFRETLFHYSAMFDMLDAVMKRDIVERMVIEGFRFGQDVVNVIACEGSERVVRAEKYKEWHARTVRAEFKPVGLEEKFLQEVKAEVKACYHKDFMICDDGHWMLQGWKGRTLYAICCWAPTQPSESPAKYMALH